MNSVYAYRVSFKKSVDFIIVDFCGSSSTSKHIIITNLGILNYN